MLLNIIRFIVAFVCCNYFLFNDATTSFVVAVVLVLLAQAIEHRDRKKFLDMEHSEIERLQTEEEILAEEDGEEFAVTDVSDEIICSYLGEDWPAWIEVDDESTFMFDGPYEHPMNSMVMFGENILVMPPGVQYKLVTEDMADEFYDMMVKCDS